jgi:hypothetical protein
MNSVSTRAVLVVEGEDEADVIGHLCKIHHIHGIRIEQLKGRDNLLPRAKSIAASSSDREVSRVGILYDSEDDPLQAQASLKKARDILMGLPHPKEVFLMQLPAPDKPGSIEALCLQAIAPNDGLLKCCDNFLACIEGTVHKLSTQARKDKLRLLTWYAASTGKPISRIGRDAYRGDRAFDYAHPAFQPLVDFLQTLVK